MLYCLPSHTLIISKIIKTLVGVEDGALSTAKLIVHQYDSLVAAVQGWHTVFHCGINKTESNV